MLLLIALGCIDSGVKAYNSAPTATITSHEDGEAHREGFTILLRGSAADTNHANSDLSATWYAGSEVLCETSAPASDGETLCEAVLGIDDTSIQLEVRDPVGDVASDKITLDIVPTDAPYVVILSPLAEGAYYDDEKITFEALLEDGEDSGDQLTAQWTSDLAGDLDVDATPDSNGATLGFGYLEQGEHALTLRATDTTGKTGFSSVVIDVGPPNTAPTCAITEPDDGGSSQEGATATFIAQADDVDVPGDWLSATFSSSLNGDFAPLTPTTEGVITWSTDLLDVGTHTITLTVLDELGLSCADAIQFTVGTPPTVAITAPSSGDVVNEGDTVAMAGVVSDTEDAPTDLAIAWSSDLDGELDTSGADSAGNVSASAALSTGSHTLRLRATDSESLFTDATVALTVNGLPSAPAVSLSPSDPDTDDDLSVSIDTGSTDPEGDTLSYSYSWLQDGNPSSASTTSLLPSSATTRDEVWTVEVNAEDPYGSGPAGAASVTIANSAPELADADLSPDPATTDEVVTCTPGSASDADGDTITYATAWEVNGARLGNSNTSLGKAKYERGDTVQCFVTPTDGSDDGAEVGSNIVTIDNSPPELSHVEISPDPATLDDTLSCDYSDWWSDADGDSDSSTIAWAINGSSAGSGTTLSSGFVGGDTVKCTVSPHDGTDAGADVSAEITIDNTPPEVSDVTISPDPAVASDTLSCTWTFSDADGDSDASTLKWFINGTNAGTSATLTGGFVKGDTVKCRVFPNDGTDSGTAVGESLVIENTAPVISSVTLSPTAPTTNQSIAATISASDDDGDTITYDYEWYVDGTKVSSTGSSLAGTSWFDKDQVVYVKVTPEDDEEPGAAVTSSSVTAVNTPPDAPVVAITPASPDEDDELICEISTASNDDDGDSVTYSIEWEVDGAAYVAGGADTADTGSVTWTGPSTTTWTDDTVPAEDTLPDETWVCTATPDDGDDSGDPASDSVTIDGEADYTDIWSLDQTVSYSCAYGFVSLNFSTMRVLDAYPAIELKGGSTQPGVMSGTFSSATQWSVSNTIAGACTETYEILDGEFTSDTEWTGTLEASFTGSWCYDCSDQSWSLTGTR